MNIDTATWNDAQAHELEYWGNCLGMRAWGEFVKQEMYGREMMLFEDYGKDWQGELNMQGASVLDVGGGPVSMTLRCVDSDRLVVVDPCGWPDSSHRRYARYGIKFIQSQGEELDTISPRLGSFDEVWVYNVLQHTQNPQEVINQSLACLKQNGKFRIFEWLNIPADTCHPHVLTAEWLLNMLSGLKVVKLNIKRLKEFWSDADAFAGVFTHA